MLNLQAEFLFQKLHFQVYHILDGNSYNSVFDGYKSKNKPGDKGEICDVGKNSRRAGADDIMGKDLALNVWIHIH